MSASNGTGKQRLILGPDGQPYRKSGGLDAKLSRAQKQLQLLETTARLRAAKMVRTQQKRIQESWNSDWINAWGDHFDRSRSVDDDFVAPISTANDVRFGDFYPFWRSWIEHARLRASSRLLHAMSPLASGAIANVGAYVIGEGMRSRAAPQRDDSPKPLLEAVQTWLDEWEQENDWSSLQIEAFDRHQVDGEYFLRLFPQDDGWTVTRLIEPMYVVEPPNEPQEIAKYGILTDPEDLCDVRGFWVSEDGQGINGDRVSAALMRQHKANVRRSVKRGMPTLSYDMLDLYKIVGRLLENMGTGAAIQAAIAFVRQHEIAPGTAVSDFVGGLADYDQQRTIGNRRENVQRFDAGTVVDMDAGQKFVETGFASNVQNYTAAVQALLRAIAVKWGAPEWVVSADASNNSYSSSLTAESPFVKRCKQKQSEFVNTFRWAVLAALRHYCKVKRGIRAAGRLWMWEEVLHYVDIQVTPPTVETRNRMEEAQLNQTYIQLGVKSRQTAAQEQNLDFEREELNNTQYEQEHGEQGVPRSQRAGEGGGGPDDAMANIPGNHPLTDAGVMGVNRDGDGMPDGQPQGQEPQQEQPTQDADAGASNNPGDLLASMGLDDIFDGEGIPDTAAPAEPADGDGEADSDDGNSLRDKVGSFNALRDMQASVYGGELPREAAIASAKLMLGFSDEEAQALFPLAQPEKTADDGDGDAESPPEPASVAEAITESVTRMLGGRVGRLLEAGYTGRKEDRIGRVRCYSDGKQVKCSSGKHAAGSQDAARDEAHEHVRRVIADPASATKEDITQLAAHLFRLTSEEVHQIKKTFGLRASGAKRSLVAKVQAEAAKVVRERQRWSRRARAAGVEPKLLFATARQHEGVAREFRTEVKTMLAETRQVYQRMTGERLTGRHKAFTGGDRTMLREFDVVARTMAGRYPGLLGAHGYGMADDDEDTTAAERLYDYLYAGTPPAPKRSQVYEDALEYLKGQSGLFKDEQGRDSEVPF